MGRGFSGGPWIAGGRLANVGRAFGGRAGAFRRGGAQLGRCACAGRLAAGGSWMRLPAICVNTVTGRGVFEIVAVRLRLVSLGLDAEA
jgi:hypothetical protein